MAIKSSRSKYKDIENFAAFQTAQVEFPDPPDILKARALKLLLILSFNFPPPICSQLSPDTPKFNFETIAIGTQLLKLNQLHVTAPGASRPFA